MGISWIFQRCSRTRTTENAYLSEKEDLSLVVNEENQIMTLDLIW
jgi:hypothetical protein